MDEAQIDHDLIPQPERLQGAVEPGQMPERRPALLFVAKGPGLAEDLFAAEQAGQAPQRLGGPAFGQAVQQIRKSGIILGLNEGADLIPDLLPHLQLLHQGLEESDMADLQTEIAPDAGQTQDIRRQGKDLQVRPLAARSDQLDPRLELLVVPPRQAVVEMIHVLRVI